MAKRVFSLLFAVAVFLSGSAFAAADIKAFAVMQINDAATASVIQNDIHFAQDYSEIIGDVCKGFVNNIVVLTSFSLKGNAPLSIKNFFKKTDSIEGAPVAGSAVKKNILNEAFVGLPCFEVSQTAGAVFFMFVVMFILWYIGLLRLFNGDIVFTKKMKV